MDASICTPGTMLSENLKSRGPTCFCGRPHHCVQPLCTQRPSLGRTRLHTPLTTFADYLAIQLRHLLMRLDRTTGQKQGLCRYRPRPSPSCTLPALIETGLRARCIPVRTLTNCWGWGCPVNYCFPICLPRTHICRRQRPVLPVEAALHLHSLPSHRACLPFWNTASVPGAYKREGFPGNRSPQRRAPRNEEWTLAEVRDSFDAGAVEGAGGRQG